LKYNTIIYILSIIMGNPEKKVIEIKNSDDTGIKDKLSENTAPRLTDNTKQSHMDAFEKVLKPA